MPSSAKRFRTTSSITFGFLAVLMAMLLSVPAAAWADHRPKHVRDSEEPSLVVEIAEPGGVVALVENEDEAEVQEALGKDQPNKELKPAGQALVDEKGGRKDAGPKHDKGKIGKLKDSGDAVMDDPGPKDACANEGCQKPKTKGQETTDGLVSVAAGSAEVIVAPGSSGATAVGEGRAGFSHVPSAGDRRAGGVSGGGRLLFDGAAILSASQPSLAISVTALNDADGDGIYSDSETAPASGADINFKAIITNMGTTAFEIAAVSHSFTRENGRVQVEVCADLDGLTLGFGESLACSFSVADYSPPMGESVVNTVTASAIEVAGSGRRGTSDSDNTTVATLLGDQVLAVAIERAPGALAFTGIDAARLVALALMLLAAGGASLYLSRVRMGGPERPVLWVGPWFNVPRLTTTAKEPRPAEKAARR